MANLTVYFILKVSNLRRVDRHLRYPGNLRRPYSTEFFQRAFEADADVSVTDVTLGASEVVGPSPVPAPSIPHHTKGLPHCKAV